MSNTYNKSESDEKIIAINTLLHDKKIEIEKYEAKKMHLIEEIKLLKAVISTNDVNEQNTNSLKCFICTDNNIECCVNPCGHTFCSSCASKNTTQKCYMCRKTIISTTKLFFDNIVLE